MTTRSKGKLKIWLFDECVVEEIRGIKPPTCKTVYLHFRYLHSEMQEKQPGTATARNSAEVAVANVKKWWSSKAGIPTKSDCRLFEMIEKFHKDWTVLFKQRAKTTQQQMNNRDAFLTEMKKTFWAPLPNCEKGLNEEDRKFLENMKGSRVGGISSLDRVTETKNKRKLEKVLEVRKRKDKEEQRKRENTVNSSIGSEDSDDSSITVYGEFDEEDADFNMPGTSSKKKKKQQEKRPAVNLNFDPCQWSDTVCLVADKHHISHRGLTEVMSAVVRSGGGSINELSLSKDTVRRHRNSIRERQAKSVFEKNLETIKASEYNRYLLHWDGKMLQSMEHAGTGAEVVAILLTATHEKHEILLKIENLDGHSTAGELTKIILETLDD